MPIELHMAGAFVVSLIILGIMMLIEDWWGKR